MLKFLSEKGAIASGEGPGGINSPAAGSETTALHFAAASGCAAAVKLLLEHGADVLMRDGVGSTALHAALDPGNYGRRNESESIALISMLIKHAQALTVTFPARAVRFTGGQRPASANGAATSAKDKAMELSAAQYLALARDARGVDALQYAFQLNKPAAIAPLRLLLNEQPATNGPAPGFMLAGRFALHAANAGSSSLVCELISAHQVLMPCCGQILHAACLRGDHELVNYILHAATWSASNASLPFPATAPARLPGQPLAPPVLQLLRTRDAAGWQPLHCAVASGCWRTVHLLCQSWGAKHLDVDTVATNGHSSPAQVSPLPPAAASPATASAAALGAAPEAPGAQLNALHLASYLGSVRIVWLLLVSLYDVRAAGPHGRNLLHYVGLGPLQGTEPWLFSTRPLDAERVIPPCAVQSTDVSLHVRQQAYIPFVQLGELGLRLGVPVCADSTGAYPHHYTAASGNLTLYELLCQKVGPVLWAALDDQSRGVLHYLCAGGADHMSKCLSDIVATKPGLALFEDCEGRIPLHYAAQVCTSCQIWHSGRSPLLLCA